MKIDLVGQVFGRLTVLERAGSTKRGVPRPVWRCRCTCGEETVVLAESLRAGRTRSCGCLRIEIARELARRRRDQRSAAVGSFSGDRAASRDRAAQLGGGR